MAIHLAASAASAAADAIMALANGWTLKIYDGARPATVATAITTQQLLASHALSATAAGSAVAGIATFNSITAATIAANGQASWFRVFASDGVTAVYDGTVSMSGADLNFDSVSFGSGATSTVTALTFQAPLAPLS